MSIYSFSNANFSRHETLSYLFSFSSILLLSSFVFGQLPFGVNLAGAEFGSDFPGTYNIDYTYPIANELDYYQSKNLKLIRLPIKWERIQPVLGENLDQTELQRINNFLQLAEDRYIQVIIDIHNYGRYSLNGTYYIIGSSSVSIFHITDMWEKLALQLKDKENVWGYGIMNEPHDLLPNASWFDIAQSIITGIRTSDINTPIIVGGDGWSSAEGWLMHSDNLKDLVDPSNNLIFEAHVYFDGDSSGRYINNYEDDGAYPNIGINRVTPFLEWLNANNLRGFIGEYGVPADDPRWLVILDNFLNYLEQNCLNGTYWAGGPWWDDYILSIEPTNGIDKPQMGDVQNYTEANENCARLSTQNITQPIEADAYPNPFTNNIHIHGLEEGTTLFIYNVAGQWVLKRKLTNGKITGLDGLKSGVYIITTKSGFVAKVMK